MNYHPDWLAKEAADSLLKTLTENIEWTQPRVKVFGKEHEVPRIVAWVGEKAYSYSGLTHDPSPWPSSLIPIKKRLEDELDAEFNGCLLNLYRDGQDCMGWHADDEKELGREPTIASMSLGHRRKFQFKPKKGLTLPPPPDVFLEHGSLLIMKGKTQEQFLHGISRSKKIRGIRINLTWRHIISPMN